MKRLIVTAVALLSLGLSTVMAQERIQNPMLWSDVPDPDIIQVDGTFYLVSRCT